MTRKDYEMLAALFAREIALADGRWTDPQNKMRVTETLQGFARLLCSEIERTNSKFNRKKFLAAAGVTE